MTQPKRVYTQVDEAQAKEVWDRMEKAFKHAEDAFKEVKKAVDSVKKE